MSDYDYDFYVIGGGSGGVRGSRIAAALGARVGLCEERYLGGTCVNVGCVPKKLMVYGSAFSGEFKDAEAYGWTVPPATFDWNTLIKNKDTEIDRLNGVYQRLLDRTGVTVHHGRGRLTGPHSVEVNGETHTAERILLSVGGWPAVPDIPGKEFAITSNEVFYLDGQPKRILIVGGGYIATEFACIFHGFGSKVTQIYRRELYLRGFDHDVRTHMAEQMIADGVDLRFEVNATAIKKTDDGLEVSLTNGETLQTDAVLFATGRTPLTGDLGLEVAGVKTDDKGAICVDEHFQTSVPSIYSVGDCIDRVALTPVALAEGMALARNLYGGPESKVDYRDIPSAVFCQPNIATVGLTEAQGRETYGEITVYKSAFRPMKYTVSGRNERTLMKLIVDKATDRVVGAHMVGPDAGEIIQGIAIALKCGATKAQFDATIGIHPTAAEEFVTMRTPVSE